MLVLLDLSAAFNTIDHEILVKRLINIGISGVAHDWFRSYLLDRSQSIYIQGTTSISVFLKYGVPQGSVLGPVLFTQYTVPIGAICRRHGVSYQLYADDTQFYITFTIGDEVDKELTRLKIEACIAKMREWVAHHKLKLNDDKTEYQLVVSSQNSDKVAGKPIQIGESKIPPTPSARNIGVMFDIQIKKVCQACLFWLRNQAMSDSRIYTGPCAVTGLITARLL